jgi:hypothetical protein
MFLQLTCLGELTQMFLDSIPIGITHDDDIMDRDTPLLFSEIEYRE